MKISDNIAKGMLNLQGVFRSNQSNFQ